MAREKRRRLQEKKRRHGVHRSSDLRSANAVDADASDDALEPIELLERPISLDEFRELRDEFFASIPARIEALKQDVVEAMAPFDAFDLLTNLLIANMPLNVETYRESEHEGMFVLVEYAGLMLLERSSREGTDVERLRPLDATVLPGLQAKPREMVHLSSFAALHAMSSGDEDERPRAIDEVRRHIVQRELFLRNRRSTRSRKRGASISAWARPDETGLARAMEPRSAACQRDVSKRATCGESSAADRRATGSCPRTSRHVQPTSRLDKVVVTAIDR